MFGNYHSGDLTAHIQVAMDNDLLLYVEYIRKRDNVFKPMEVHPQTLYPTHVMVTDRYSGGIKRLNLDRIWRIGIEVKANG